MQPLRANDRLACPGVQLSGQGFVLDVAQAESFSTRTRKIWYGHISRGDLTQERREQYVIDTFGLDESLLRDRHPDAYQWLFDRVRPERMQNPLRKHAREWWLPSEPCARFREALRGLRRLVGTSRTAAPRVSVSDGGYPS